ncbi:MAG: hypothetical protein ACHQYP_11570 [Nitrospiria bacterium]
MNKSAATLFLVGLLTLNIFIVSSISASEITINGGIQITDYLYDQLDKYYGPPEKRSNYFLEKVTFNTVIKSGMAKGVVELYLNNIDQNNQSDGGFFWGSSGAGSNITLDPLIHQAFLELPVLGGTLSGGRRLMMLGHGLVLNDTADNILLNYKYSIFNLDLAYLKLIAIDSINKGNPDDFDTDGYIVKINAKFNETDSMELFYAVMKEGAPIGLIDGDNSALALGIAGGGKAGEIDWSAEYDQITGNDGNYTVNLPRWGNNLLITGSTKRNFGRIGLELLQIKGQRSANEVSYNSFAGDFVGGHGILLNDQTRYGGGIDLNSGMVDMADPTTKGYWHYLSHNFTSVKAFLEFNPYKKLAVTLEVFPYVLEIHPDVLGLQSGNIGSEGNVTGVYPFDEHLKLSAGVAYFKAGDIIKEIASVSNTPSFGQNIMKTSVSLIYLF